MWYAAHVVLSLRFCEGEQDTFPVHETVFLVEAGSAAEARAIATRIGREEGSYDKPSGVYGDVPVRLAFEGVRKVVECLPADRLATGTELTYTQFVLDSEEALTKLLDGDDVAVTIRDFDDAPPDV